MLGSFWRLYKNTNLKKWTFINDKYKGIWVVFGLPVAQRPEHRKEKGSLHFWSNEKDKILYFANAVSILFDGCVI